MTSKDFTAELDKQPFIPFRVHMVSGKTLDVKLPKAAWLMQNSVLIFQDPVADSQAVTGYDVVALRNIERLEQTLDAKPARRGVRKR